MQDHNKNSYLWQDFAELPDNPYVLRDGLMGFKCLLVHLTREGDLSKNDYPLPYGYMASLVRMNGGTAEIETMLSHRYHSEDYAGFDFICFYPMAVMLKPILKLAERVKEDFPEVKLCLLNSDQHQHEMPLCAPEAAEFGRTLMEACEAVDFVLIGEAEYSFLRLCSLSNDNKNDYDTVPACLYRTEGGIEFSGKPIVPLDFEYIPYPAREHLEETIDDAGINHHSPRIQSSRGCVSSCMYCVESSANITAGGRKRPWLGRDISCFVDEIEMLQREYGAVFFNITDSSFEDPGRRGIERMRRFCEEIIQRQIEASFKAHFRMETFDKLDDDFLRLLKRAGVDILVVGVESGVDNELKSYQKITSAQTNIDNVRRLDEFGEFFTLFGYMMFSPYLELGDLWKKVDFLEQIHRGWDYLNMSNNLLVFRGTTYHKFIQERGLALPAEELSTVIPYRYLDQRVKFVAEEMGKLKKRCPEVIRLQNLFYDALNIVSRYHNKMNRHLWAHREDFRLFRGRLSVLLEEVEAIYLGYFRDLLQLAGDRWDAEEAEAIYYSWIPHQIATAAEGAEFTLSEYLSAYKSKGLSIARLYLKTWMSLINTETNTAGGETE